jgi:RNA polymerase sigma-70 factor (ECF subfamily)
MVENVAVVPLAGAGGRQGVDPWMATRISADEQRLVALAKRGDASALRRLYDSFESQVRAHLYRLLGPDPELDDMVQIVFARAFASLGTFRGESAIGTWLYRITTNITHNLVRQRFRRARLLSAVSWFHEAIGGHDRPPAAEARDEVQRLLMCLRPDLREVFVLYHYEGLTLAEISGIVVKPVSTVGECLTRARKRLRDLVSS